MTLARRSTRAIGVCGGPWRAEARLLAARAEAAQTAGTADGTIHGTITDSTGASMPDVSVVITSVALIVPGSVCQVPLEVTLIARRERAETVRTFGVRRGLAPAVAARDEGLSFVLQVYQLDALLFPERLGSFIGAKAGFPSVHVPAGYLPDRAGYGVTFLGRAFSEPVLIGLAYAYEQVSLARRPPASAPPLR